MRKHPVLLFAAVLGGAILIGLGNPVWPTLLAITAMYLLFRVGMTVLGGLARPVPEPPPAGELRKVKIAYRCSICGTEVRMTIAPDQDPEPPRHCQEDMDLITPVDDL